MNRTNTPQIKSVTTTKEGRFWALKADGKLLAIVLYKTGAVELKRLIQGLAGLPIDESEGEKAEAKATKAKVPAKKESGKAKTAATKTAAAKPGASLPASAKQNESL